MTLSRIILTALLFILCIWLYYIGQGPHYKSIDQDSDEYRFIHKMDTLDESRGIVQHHWYKDSNDVWHSDNGRVDSSRYKMKGD